jgi:exopolysaccharide biosynthesis polyprenyl glycosylphosphotransferase
VSAWSTKLVLREYDQVLRYSNIVLDLMVTVVSVFLAAFLRDHVVAPYLAPGLVWGKVSPASLFPLTMMLPLCLVVLLRIQGQYESLRTARVQDITGPVLMASMGTALAGMVAAFFLDSSAEPRAGLSRLILVLFAVCAFCLLTAKHILIRALLQRIRVRGYNWRTLVLVGSAADVTTIARQISMSPQWGFRVVATLLTDRGRPSIPVDVAGTEIAGAVHEYRNQSELAHYLHTAPVDEVILVSHTEPLEKLAGLFETCEEMGIRTRLTVQFFRNTLARPRMDYIEAVPLVTWSPAPDASGALLIKHVFDRIAATGFLIVFSPVLLGVALLVKLTSNKWSDPILFGQSRCGLNGRLFTMWKFRTMVVNADSLVNKLQGQNEMGGPVFKIKHDPRITPVGRLLRRLSLDELPQLYNVMVGDMSLVGPRPPLPREVAKYDRWQRRRLSMKPGITCLWQVSGRNNLPFETWMKLDLEYIDNWSLWLDIKILFRTVYAVSTGHGAM